LENPSHVAIISNTTHFHNHHTENPSMNMRTYSELGRDSGIFANSLIELHENESVWDGSKTLKLLPNRRICYLFEPSYEYTVVMFGEREQLLYHCVVPIQQKNSSTTLKIANVKLSFTKRIRNICWNRYSTKSKMSSLWIMKP